MGTQALLAVLCWLTLSETSGEAVNPVNSLLVKDNASAESAPRLYRSVPVGVYASAAPYASYSYRIPTILSGPITSASRAVPVKEHAVLNNVNAYLRDSYGNRFVGNPQTAAYKATIPQQYVQLQALPAHFAEPLAAAAPNFQVKQEAPQTVFGSHYRLPFVQAVSSNNNFADASQPFVYGQNVRSWAPSSSGHSQFQRLVAPQQQSPSNRALYTHPYQNYYNSNSGPKFQRLEEKPTPLKQVVIESNISQFKEVPSPKDHGNLKASPDTQRYTTIVNGKKTIIEVETKPVPLLDLTLLEPLTFDNPVVPQVQHFLPRINQATYKKLSEFNNQQKKTEIQNHKPKSKKKQKRPVQNDDTLLKQAPVEPTITVKGTPNEGPEIFYEINTPNHKETYKEKTVSYNKETNMEPVTYSYDHKEDAKPVSYSYGNIVQKEPVHHSYVSHEPKHNKDAYQKDAPQHLIYTFKPEEQIEEENDGSIHSESEDTGSAEVFNEEARQPHQAEYIEQHQESPNHKSDSKQRDEYHKAHQPHQAEYIEQHQEFPKHKSDSKQRNEYHKAHQPHQAEYIEQHQEFPNHKSDSKQRDEYHKAHQPHQAEYIEQHQEFPNHKSDSKQRDQYHKAHQPHQAEYIEHHQESPNHKSDSKQRDEYHERHVEFPNPKIQHFENEQQVYHEPFPRHKSHQSQRVDYQERRVEPRHREELLNHEPHRSYEEHHEKPNRKEHHSHHKEHQVVPDKQSLSSKSHQPQREHPESLEYRGHQEHEEHREHQGHQKHREHQEHREHREKPEHREHQEHQEHQKHREHQEHREKPEHREYQKHREHQEHREKPEHREHQEHQKHRDHQEHREYPEHQKHREHQEHRKKPEHREHSPRHQPRQPEYQERHEQPASYNPHQQQRPEHYEHRESHNAHNPKFIEYKDQHDKRQRHQEHPRQEHHQLEYKKHPDREDYRDVEHVTHKPSPQQYSQSTVAAAHEPELEAKTQEYEEDIRFIPTQGPNAAIQVDPNQHVQKITSNQPPHPSPVPQHRQEDSEEEQPDSNHHVPAGPVPVIHETSKRIIIQEETPEEMHSHQEQMLAKMLEEQENNEEDFEKAYKNAAFGFPGYNKNSDDIERDIYNPDSYGVSHEQRYEIDHAPFQEYQAEGDEFPKTARLRYKDTRDDIKNDYYLDYSIHKPESIAERHKKKKEYYKLYENFKPEKYFADEKKEKQKDKYTLAPSFSFNPEPAKEENKHKPYFAQYKAAPPKFEYSYSKPKARDNSAFASRPYQRYSTSKTHFVEPQFQYGFEPIAIPRLLDSELAAMASNDSPESDKPGMRKKVYKENWYIKKTSTAGGDAAS